MSWSDARPRDLERHLATDSPATSDDAGRIATVNDALSDIAHRLDARSGWPPAALRISLLSGLFLVVLAFVFGRIDLVLPLVAVGGLSTAVSAEIGRRARRVAKRQREAVDALIDVAVQHLTVGARIGSETEPRRPRSRYLRK